jgi:hypothetical protein
VIRPEWGFPRITRLPELITPPVPINVGRAMKIVAFGDSNVVVDFLADTQRHSRSQGAVDPPLTVRNYGDEWRHLVWSLGRICRGAGSRGAFAVAPQRHEPGPAQRELWDNARCCQCLIDRQLCALR